MDIISAYYELGSYRGAADRCGTTHRTVKKIIDKHEADQAGVPPAPRAQRPHNYDAVAELVTERVEKSQGRISAKRLLPVARAAGYEGSGRNFRRLVAQSKAVWRSHNHSGRRPAVWSPGEYLVIDWTQAAPGLFLFCAVLAFSRWRFVRFATDQKASTTLALIAEAMAAIGKPGRLPAVIGGRILPAWEAPLPDWWPRSLRGVLTIVVLALFPALVPVFAGKALPMTTAVQIVMLGYGALILFATGVKAPDIARSSVFTAGMIAVVSIFGIAWMSDTFVKANETFLVDNIKAMVEYAPWTFALAMFAVSAFVKSQAATLTIMIPFGLALSLPVPLLLGLMPSSYAYFFFAFYPSDLAAINMDRTGTTHIGKYLLNHSFMIPGLIGVGVSTTMLPPMLSPPTLTGVMPAITRVIPTCAGGM